MNKTKKKRLITLSILGISLSIFLYLIFTAVSIWSYGNADEKVQSEVAIVLGAATSNGKVSPVYQERINHGIWLYENGYVKYLIFTGGFGEGNAESDAFAAKQYAVSQGVPEEIIFIEEKSTITEENLEQSKLIMDENSFKTAIIVSDPLHMKRAMLMAKDYGITAYPSPTPATRYQTLKTKLPFLAREEFFYVGYRLVRLFRK